MCVRAKSHFFGNKVLRINQRTDAVIGWAGDSPLIRSYHITQRSPSGIQPSPNYNISQAFVYYQNNDTIITFRRYLNTGNHLIQDDRSTIMFVALSAFNAIRKHTVPPKIYDINFKTGNVSVANTFDLRTAHGILMIIGWGLILPFGAIISSSMNFKTRINVRPLKIFVQ